MPSIVTVDDRDSSIQYSGTGWTPGGVWPEYQNTTSGSTHNGDTATFTFTGTWVSVYATSGNSGGNGVPTIQFSVDGGAPYSWTTPNISSFPMYHYQTFASDVLNDTTHTLLIQNTSPSCPPCMTWFDFIEYIPSQSNSSQSTSPTSKGPSPSASFSPSSVTTSPSGTTNLVTSHTSTAALAGGIGGGLGGASLLVALAMSCFYYRRYRMERRQRLQLVDEMAARPSSYQQISQQPQESEAFLTHGGLPSTIERAPRQYG